MFMQSLAESYARDGAAVAGVPEARIGRLHHPGEILTAQKRRNRR